MTQPAVTFQIKQLEEQFNTRLLERGHGKVSLTQAGEIAFNYADQILSLSDEMETRINELTDDLAGTLSIGASRTIAAYWLPMLLDQFKRQYPRVQPKVMVGNSDLIIERVLAHEIDVGMVERGSDDPALQCTLACTDELLAVVPPDHPLANKTAVTAAELQKFPIVDHDPGAAIRALSEGFFRNGGVNPDSLDRTAELGSLAVIKQFVRNGLGFAIVSRASLSRDLRDGTLVAIPLEPRLMSPLNVVVPKDKFRARLHSTFADAAVSYLAETAASASVGGDPTLAARDPQP